MNAPTTITPPAPTETGRSVGAGAAGPVPALVQSGLPHPLFSQAWSDALTLRAAHIAHGHTAASDDAIGPCLIAERAQARLIMALDSLRGEPSTLPQRLCGRTRTVTLRRLANSMALIAAAYDAIARMPATPAGDRDRPEKTA